MKKKIKYEDALAGISAAISKSVRIKDVLPPPDKLVKKDENIRITINLNKNCISFFKKKAKRQGVPYQKMIKSVLAHYVQEFK